MPRTCCSGPWACDPPSPCLHSAPKLSGGETRASTCTASSTRSCVTNSTSSPLESNNPVQSIDAEPELLKLDGTVVELARYMGRALLGFMIRPVDGVDKMDVGKGVASNHGNRLARGNRDAQLGSSAVCCRHEHSVTDACRELASPGEDARYEGCRGRT